MGKIEKAFWTIPLALDCAAEVMVTLFGEIVHCIRWDCADIIQSYIDIQRRR